MEIKQFIIGMMQTNCYLAVNNDTKECFMVDAPYYDARVTEYIRENGLRLQAILLTHGHFDHIMGIDGFLKEFPVPVYAHEEEKALLENAVYNLTDGLTCGYVFKDAVYVADGQEIDAAGIKVRVVFTPGHTQGGCCYYLEKEKVLFSGDTLFCQSVGRTDLPTGSMAKLVHSVREKLFTLPEETVVYPGHMEATTIRHERLYNEEV